MDIKEIISQQINIQNLSAEQFKSLIIVPPKENMGDFCLPCFSFAKVMHKSPNDIANQISNSLSGNKMFEKTEVLNGYLNLYLNKSYFTKEILDEINSNLENFGKQNIGKGKLACFEYSSINVAKSPHVGHLCTTLFGECFSRLYENFGFNVKRINYLGDYGTQFGKVITAYKKWGNKEDLEKRGITALQELYVRMNEACETNLDMLEECRQTFYSLECGDAEVLKLYDWFVKLSIDEATRVLYKPLEINFDDWRGERYYSQFNEQSIKLLQEKGLVKEDDGALVVDLKEYNLGVVIVRQKSGASLYATRDISTLLNRYKEYHYDKFVYVTDMRQKLYFQQIFKIGELLGCDFISKVQHVMNGMLSLPEGKISSRKGAVALIKDLFSLSTQKAEEVLKSRGTISDDQETLVKQIGIGALVFSVLKTTRLKDSVFDINTAINFEGETGPYLQYTFARCASIIRKAEDFSAPNFSCLDDGAFELVKHLQKFEETLFAAYANLEPSYIARYAISLASLFNKYYSENRIITQDKEKTKAQVALTNIVKTVLGKCLRFLVMQAPEKM